MDPYLIAKYLHILSSTLLFGTGIGTAFQMVWAMRTGRPETIHSVASGVVIADWIFTTPAGLIQPATGLWLIQLQGYSLTEPWLILTYALYLLALVCWVPVVRLQIRYPRSGGRGFGKRQSPLAGRSQTHLSALVYPRLARIHRPHRNILADGGKAKPLVALRPLH